jgi:hypothetical protein
VIQLQKQLRNMAKENFEFRRVITRGMAHFDVNNLSHCSFYHKSDISDGLVSLGFDVISVKQMTATCRSPPEGQKTMNLPLFLITLPRTAKSQ